MHPRQRDPMVLGRGARLLDGGQSVDRPDSLVGARGQAGLSGLQDGVRDMGLDRLWQAGKPWLLRKSLQDEGFRGGAVLLVEAVVDRGGIRVQLYAWIE